MKVKLPCGGEPQTGNILEGVDQQVQTTFNKSDVQVWQFSLSSSDPMRATPTQQRDSELSGH